MSDKEICICPECEGGIVEEVNSWGEVIAYFLCQECRGTGEVENESAQISTS